MYLSFKPTGRCRSPGKAWKPGAAITHLSGRGVGGCPFHSGGALNSPVSCAARSSRKKNDFKYHVPSFFFRLWERGCGGKGQARLPHDKSSRCQKVYCDKFLAGCFSLFFTSDFVLPSDVYPFKLPLTLPRSFLPERP